jgi:glutamyl-tRNA(Gln) amidotransferase subunit E
MDADLPPAVQSDEFYRRLGLRCGIEVHQQLATAEKLFCRCPVGPYSSEWDAEIIRHMRPTLSELGAFDPTALMEFKTRKRIVYQITRDTTCTYEMDDAPPFRLNEEALDAALEVALLLKCNVVGEMHIARKQYLDGSIPTGFQRTALLGVDGEIPFRGRRVRIAQIGLEEDSARLVDDRGHVRTFRTDRLSIPLLEVVTGPSLRTPGEAAEICESLRRLHRVTGRVRTGLGTARQDVNVSIRGGTRTELKGVARIGEVPALVHVEAIRQRQLLLLRDEIRIRGLRLERWRPRSVDLTGALRPREPANLTSALAYGGRVTAVVLPGFAGLLAHPLQPGGIDFAGELADRVRVIACLDQLPNLLHSDDPEWGGLPGPDRIAVRKRAKLTDRDALVLVWGAAPDVRVAVEEIEFRAREAFLGVPAESRRALAGGRSAFLRILPGPDRMYPDTDLPLTRLGDARIDRVAERLPEPPWERERRHREEGLPEDVIRALALRPRLAGLHDRLVAAGHPAREVGRLLVDAATGLRREGLRLEDASADAIVDLLGALAEGRIHREVRLDLLRRLARGEADAVASFPPPLTDEERDALVDRAREEARGRSFRTVEARRRFTMGRVMREARGRLPGAATWRLLAEVET